MSLHQSVLSGMLYRKFAFTKNDTCWNNGKQVDDKLDTLWLHCLFCLMLIVAMIIIWLILYYGSVENNEEFYHQVC